MSTKELKMLRWIQGKTRKDHIRNVIIRGKAHIEPIYTFLTKNFFSARVQQRDDDNITKSVLTTQIEGSRPRGRPRLRWMDRIKQDKKQNKTRTEWASLPRKRRKSVKVRRVV